MAKSSAPQSANWAEIVWGLLILFLGIRELMLWGDGSSALLSRFFNAIGNLIPKYDLTVVSPWVAVLVIGYGLYIIRDARAIFSTVDSHQRGVQLGCLAVAACCAYSLLSLLLALIDTTANVPGARESITTGVLIAVVFGIVLAYLASLDFYRESSQIPLAAANDIWDCNATINFTFARMAGTDDSIPLISKQLTTMEGELRRILDQHSQEFVAAFNGLDGMYDAFVTAASPELSSQELVTLNTQLDYQVSRLTEKIQQDFERVCRDKAQKLLAGKRLKLGSSRCQIEVQMPVLKKSALFEQKRREITEARNAARSKAVEYGQEVVRDEMLKGLSGLKSPEETKDMFDRYRQIADPGRPGQLDGRQLEPLGAGNFPQPRQFPGQQELPPFEGASFPGRSLMDGYEPPRPNAHGSVPPLLNRLSAPASSGSSGGAIDPADFAARLIQAVGRDWRLDDEELDEAMVKFFSSNNFRLNDAGTAMRSALAFINLLQHTGESHLTEQLVLTLLQGGEIRIWQ